MRNQLVRVIGRFRSLPSPRPVYRILAYHRIKPRQRLAFGGQLDRLVHHGNVVTPREFLDDEGREDQINVLLTFDDGYLEWETIVLKALANRDLTAIFFVNPDFVGLPKKEARRYCEQFLDIQPTPPLTEDGVDRIREEGHVLGNHLVRHEDLRRCEDEMHMDVIFEESQQLFKTRFDVEPRWVAYPFADYFRAPDSLVRRAENHFEAGVSLIPGWNHSNSERLLLNRDAFSPDYSRSVERAWLRGGYDPVFRLTHLHQSLLPNPF